MTENRIGVTFVGPTPAAMRDLGALPPDTDLEAVIADLRLDLPFVEQDRWPSGEEGLGVEIELGARYGVLVEADDRVGDLGCSGGLSARLRPLDEDCAHHA